MATFSGGNLPTFYAVLYGVVADDSTNQFTALNNLLASIPALSTGAGGYVQLPPGNYTLLTSCALAIPANVIIVGCGTNGLNTNDAPTPICGLHMTHNGDTYHIQCLQKGVCGLKDLIVKDDQTSTTFMIYTASVPYLDNVQFVGKQKANDTTKCVSNPAFCPVNDGISFGVPGKLICNTGTITNSDFCGYGANHVSGLYFQNIRTAISLNEDANGLNFYNVQGDFSDAYTSGYFISLSSSSSSNATYGNTFRGINIEQAPFQDTMHCNYYGAFGLNTNAVSNQISYGASDVGNCAHGTYILDLSSFWNDITQLDVQYQNASPAVSDVSTAYSNGIYDVPNRTLYRQTYVGNKLVGNKLVLSLGIDSLSNVTGIPNVDALGGIVGFNGTSAGAFSAGNYQLFSDGASNTSQFTVFPLEAWLGQFTLNTSTANGTAPIQMQPAYSVGGPAQPSPIVFSVPAGAIAQSYPTNAPPFYASAENQISFQGSTPTSGATYAIVRGFSASIIGGLTGGIPAAASTVLGTYYNSSLPPGSPTIYYTSFSQQTGWANPTENKAYTVAPFAYTAKGLCVLTSSTQGSGGSLMIVLRRNGSSPTGTPTVTIPSSGAAGAWCDNSDSLSNSGSADTLDLQLTNNDSVHSSANIVSITLALTPTSPATGVLVFGLGAMGAIPPPGVNTNYFAPFGGSNLTITSANAQVALPRAVMIKNLHCYITICPGTNGATFTVAKNGTAGSLTITAAPISCGAPRDISDTNSAHAISFNQGDTIELLETQSSGTGPSAASCTVEHD